MRTPQDHIEYKSPIPCEGHQYWTDWGWEYDCGYGGGTICEDCICVEGGTIDPRTDKKYSLLSRFFDFLRN